MPNTRIELTDNIISAIMKLSEGNPGAMNVCIQLDKEGVNIDTDSFCGGLGQLLSLDAEHVYGPKIWMLYKDVCKEQLWKMIAVMRAVQLGIITNSVLHHAIENRGDGLNVDECITKVIAQLPGFKVPVAGYKIPK